MIVTGYELEQKQGTEQQFINAEDQGAKKFSLPQGLIGFSWVKQCTIEVFEKGPIHMLSSLSEENLFFYLVNPYLVNKDYTLDISDEYFASLGSPKFQEIAVFSILTLSESNSTCNLLGPLVINTESNIAYQCINNAGDWGTKHYLSNGQKCDEFSPEPISGEVS